MCYLLFNDFVLYYILYGLEKPHCDVWPSLCRTMCTEFDTRKLFSHSSAEGGKFPFAHCKAELSTWSLVPAWQEHHQFGSQSRSNMRLTNDVASWNLQFSYTENATHCTFLQSTDMLKLYISLRFSAEVEVWFGLSTKTTWLGFRKDHVLA